MNKLKSRIWSLGSGKVTKSFKQTVKSINSSKDFLHTPQYRKRTKTRWEKVIDEIIRFAS